MRVEDQLCFALYAASRAITGRYRPLLEPLGLTYPQYLVLLALWERATPVPVKDLGSALQLDYGTLTPLLKRLGEAGLVERRRGQADERTVLIELTNAGRQLEDRARGIPCSIEHAMGLDRVEFDAAMNLVRTLTRHVHAGEDATADHR